MLVSAGFIFVTGITVCMHWSTVSFSKRFLIKVVPATNGRHFLLYF